MFICSHLSCIEIVFKVGELISSCFRLKKINFSFHFVGKKSSLLWSHPYFSFYHISIRYSDGVEVFFFVEEFYVTFAFAHQSFQTTSIQVIIINIVFYSIYIEQSDRCLGLRAFSSQINTWSKCWYAFYFILSSVPVYNAFFIQFFTHSSEFTK